MDPKTLQATHISRGPVIAPWRYAELGGHVDENHAPYLIVGTVHIIWEQGVELLRFFLGEGDQFSCVDEVPFASIKWHELDPQHTVEPPREELTRFQYLF